MISDGLCIFGRAGIRNADAARPAFLIIYVYDMNKHLCHKGGRYFYNAKDMTRVSAFAPRL